MNADVMKYRQLIEQNGNYDFKILDIANTLRDDFNCERVSIYFKENDGRFITVVAQGLEDMSIDVKIGEGLAGKSLKYKKPLISNECIYDHRSLCRVRDNYTGFKTHSILVAPIITLFFFPVGLVQLINKINGEFNMQEAQQLMRINKIIGKLRLSIPRPLRNIWKNE